MTTYTIVTDAVSTTINAESANEAAAKFARSEGWRGVSTVKQWRDHLESLGGYGHIADEHGDIVRVRRDGDREDETMTKLFAAVGSDGWRPVVWGIGRTPEEARQDACEWLDQSGDDTGDAMDTEIHEISEEQAAVVRAGGVSWPIEA